LSLNDWNLFHSALDLTKTLPKYLIRLLLLLHTLSICVYIWANIIGLGFVVPTPNHMISRTLK